jgi:GTPase SAR1 family protein
MKSYSTRRSKASYQTGRESNATHLTDATEMEPEDDFKAAPYYSKKMVVVGDGGCGKTCLLITYSKGYFPDVLTPRFFYHTSC